jgi:hypothetical protein
MGGLADPAGLIMRPRGPILSPGAALALDITGIAIALDPVLHRRDADMAIARRFAARHPSIKTSNDQLDTLPSRQPPTLAVHPD